jgi:hypothetical protein
LLMCKLFGNRFCNFCRLQGKFGFFILQRSGRKNVQTYNLLPRSAREGDVIRISVSVDDKATSERRNRVEKLMDELFED